MNTVKSWFIAAMLSLSAAACTLEASVETTMEPEITSEPTGTVIATEAAAPSPAAAPGREAFMELNSTTAPWWASVLQTYSDAQAAGEAWTGDPEQIALRLAGYNESAPPEFQPTALEVERTDANAVYLVTSESMQDDSIRSQQLRVEMSSDGTVWRIDWAGGRWTCQPGRGQEDWAPALCI